MISRPQPGPLTTLVDRWLRGFGVSRQVPVRRDGAVTEVEVGGQERRLELVLVDPDEALVAQTLARLLGTTDVWSTIFTPQAREWDLPPGVTEQLTGERLMVASLIGTAADKPIPAVGRVDLTLEGDRAFVRILDGDVVAAQGQLGLVGTDAVFDRIETDQAYRRRGLGTVVMAELARWAVGQGAERGILAASSDGQALYSQLGWEAAGAMVTIAATQAAPVGAGD